MNMFNIQRKIFTAVYTAVTTASPSCRVTNAFVYTPASFPCVAVVMSDDGTRYDMRDSSNTDNFRDVTITVDVYSNKHDGMKSEAESLMQTVIDTLFPLNFNMVSCRPVSNINNATNYRITATFVATVGGDETIYTRR